MYRIIEYCFFVFNLSLPDGDIVIPVFTLDLDVEGRGDVCDVFVVINIVTICVGV